jgi:hypothetical protein
MFVGQRDWEDVGCHPSHGTKILGHLSFLPLHNVIKYTPDFPGQPVQFLSSLRWM